MIRSDKLTPDQILFLQEAVAAASALAFADRLGVLARLDASYKDIQRSELLPGAPLSLITAQRA